jgi:hypothetical protein
MSGPAPVPRVIGNNEQMSEEKAEGFGSIMGGTART